MHAMRTNKPDSPNETVIDEPLITIYVAPGYNSCNVYSMPYGMRPGQSPTDLHQRYKDEWSHIAQLNHELKLRWLDPAYALIADEIQGQGPGTFFSLPIGDVFGRSGTSSPAEYLVVEKEYASPTDDDPDDDPENYPPKANPMRM